MCDHNELSLATSSDWETVCADCGEVIEMKTKAKFGGWSEKVCDGVRQIWVIVSKGKSLGKVFGVPAWEWRGRVVVNGKVMWSGKVSKTDSSAKILDRSGVSI